MDIRSWNKILLQWITKCNFVENNFFTVEQTNIDSFYQKICSQHTEACKFSSLQSLLQTHYPHFKPHVDDENALSAAEYIYVYSLLLHFCCVKCPEEYFQIICQKLSEQTQQSIAVFFEHIIACPNINKEIIRQAIAKVNNFTSTAQQQKSETISSSLASSNGVNGSDLQTSFSTSSIRLNGDSPISTPNRKTMSAIQRISPDTPKSSLLEERTRELYNYKALLETERYEKNLLELQITQNEKQIESMTQEHKNLQLKIQELRDELLNKSIDPNVHDHEENEMLEALRRDLCKKIREKEQENYRLFDSINTLREEKTLLEGKLRLAESKLTSYREYIKELELKMEELTADIQKKDFTIKTLTDDKADLEHFIAETRSASSSSRPNFDSSIDCLDASFSRYTNSSGSLGSPENLGASVIDVQLREKEHENNQLRQELNELRERQIELATLIQSKTKSYMQEYTFETNNNADIMKSNEKSNDAKEYFNFYVECMNHLGKSFKDAKNQIEKLNCDLTEMGCENIELNKRINELECEVSTLNVQIKALDVKNDSYLDEIEKLQGLKQELAKNYETSLNEYEARLKQSQLQCQQVENQSMALNEQIAKLEKNLEELNRLAQNAEAECNSLREKSANQNAKLKAHMEAERLVKEKYEQTLIENDGLRSKIRESDAHLEIMRSNIQGKEMELGKLGKEIVQLGCTNIELEDKIDKLTQNYKNERTKHDADIEKLNNELYELQKAYGKLQKTFEYLSNEKETAFEKVEDLCQLLQVNVTEIDLNDCLERLCNAARKLLVDHKQLQMEMSNLVKEHDNKIEVLNENLKIGEQKIHDFKTAVDALTTQIENSKKTIDEMSLEVQELQRQTVMLKEHHQAEKMDWSKKHEQLQAELEGEKEVRAAKMAELEQTQNEKTEFETQVIALNKLKTELEEQLMAFQELKEAHEALQTEKVALETSLETQISGLESQNEEWKAKYAAECELNSKNVEQLEAVNSELKNLQTKHENMQQDFEVQQTEWKQSLDVEKQSLADCKQQLEEANAKLEQLESLHTKSQQDFEEKLKTYELKIEELNKENQKLVTEIQTCKDEQKATESNLIKADEACQQMSKQLEETIAMLATRNAKLEESQQMLNVASEKLASKSEILKTLQANCDKQTTELQQLLAKCEKQTTDLEAASTEIEHLKAVCDNKAQEIINFKNKQDFYNAENENLKSKLHKVENELSEKKRVFEAKIEDLIASKTCLVAQLNSNLKHKEARINELESLMHDTEKCLKTVNDDSAKLQSELVSKEDELRMLNEELSITKTELQQIENIVTIIEVHELCDLPKLLTDVETNQSIVQRLKAGLISKATTHIDKEKEKLEQSQTQVNELKAQLNNSNDACAKMQLQLETQKQQVRKLNAEQQDLKNELKNLEAVNEKVSQENETLQLKLSNAETDLKTIQNQFGALRSLNERLTNRIDELDQRYLRDLEAMKAEQQTLVDNLSAQKLAYQTLQKQNDEMQSEVTETENTARQRLENFERELIQSKKEKEDLEKVFNLKIEEHNLLAEKLVSLEAKNADDEAQIAQLKKKNILLSVEFSELNEKHQNLYNEIQSVTNQLEAANTECASTTESLSQKREEIQKLKGDLQAAQVQIKVLKEELKLALAQHKESQSEKQKVSEELNALKRNNHDLSKEVNDLKQQIALNELEIDDLKRQKALLCTQVEVNSRYQTTSESKLKNIIETSQALERNLLSTENELKTMRAKLEQSKVNTEKLEVENQKLRENAESLNKRIEKFAIKLGDAQALALKFERENEKLNKQLIQHTTCLEALQRDKNVLQAETKSLNERLNKSERLQEQVSTKLQAVEKTNATLVAAKKVLETSEVDLKTKLRKLENVRQMNEDRIRKLTHDCERSERETVNLNHQIGALNNEIYALKKSNKTEEQNQKEELTKQLNELRISNENYVQLNQELESQQRELKHQLEAVTDKLSKVSLSLEISNTKKSELNMIVEQLESKIKTLQSDKAEFEKAQQALTARLKESQDFTEQLLRDKRALEEQLEATNAEILNKNTELTALRLELNDVRLSSVESTAAINDKTSALVAEIDSLKARLKAIENLLTKEQETTAQLRLDNQILQAKYRDAKHRIETENTTTEERIKENRLELEGKLEKMKNKMKALYTEEVTKMKMKQERETASLRAELSTLKSQNLKYEEHTRKLSAELMSLNDRMLECQKENTHLLTKLKYIQNEENNKFKRPIISNAAPTSSISVVQRIPSTQSMPSNIGTDLAMEDEEGEIFNNTYLADLKNGRITQDICPEELMRRNSQLPPHLKSSYAPQYDHGLCEDEVKDGMDDSMSALISSNTSCTRKKMSGVTHYRKPGPPTPSKNGGRLSFGGSSEPAREILKESYDDSGNNTSNKTPARFGFFSSRFSMGSNNQTKDERIQKQKQNTAAAVQTPQTPKCNTQELRRTIYRRKFETENVQSVEHVPSVTKMLTSTPRPSKNRIHIIDKRRLIHEMQSASSTPSENEPNDITPPELSVIATSSIAKCSKRRSSVTGAKKLKPTNVSRNSIGIKVAELQRRIRRRRERRERPSLCVQKNIYASKCCTPQRTAQRDLNRILGRRDRLKNFDRQRGFLNVSYDDIENENSSKPTPESNATNVTTNDATYDIINSKLQSKTESEDDDKDFNYTSDDYEEENETCETATFDLQTIDGATYKIASNEQSEINTIIQSESNDENMCSKSQVIGNETEISGVENDTAKEVSAFEEELEQLQTEIYPNVFSSSARFEQLLKETECEAPFKVDNLRLSEGLAVNDDEGMDANDVLVNFSSESSTEHLKSKTQNSKHSSLALVPIIKTPTASQNSEKVFECVTPTPHCSTASSNRTSVAFQRASLLHHSRTIYGASVIFNRRIPNIDTVQVRKSSIYFKNPKCSTFRNSCNLSTIDSIGSPTATGLSHSGDLILVTNQTITIFDLICMWQQMSSGTRFIVGAILIGFLSTFLALIHSIWSYI